MVGPDKRLVMKKLIIGRDFGNSVEVVHGITEADALVVNAPDSLKQGQKVDISTSKEQ